MKKEIEKPKNMRVRAAPSPTGEPHIGNLRTFLYDYLAAKHYSGKFILRIEDTDKKREVKGGIEIIMNMLKEYDLLPDEGPDVGGKFGPYIQSERKEIYKKYAEELVEKDAAYYCFCSEEELAKDREAQEKKGVQPGYAGHCREHPIADAKKRIEKGEKFVIRLKVPDKGECSFTDLVFGIVTVPYKCIDDQVLLKSDGFPTYHFGVVIDDHEMQITHVLRGYEYLSSTPKDILIYKAFDWEVPEWVHMPLIVGKDGKKLSKRSGALAAMQYLKEGYLVDAILNYIALLGWNPGDESTVMTRKDLIEKFTLERVLKTPARFDAEKFIWLNGEHIRSLSVDELKERFFEWMQKYGEEKVEKELARSLLEDKQLDDKLVLIKERIKLLSDIPLQLKFFYFSPKNSEYKKSGIEKGSDELHDALIELHETADLNNQETWEGGVRNIADGFGISHGDAFMQLRIAVSGSRFSPPLRESLVILGKDEVLVRLKAYRES